MADCLWCVVITLVHKTTTFCATPGLWIIAIRDVVGITLLACAPCRQPAQHQFTLDFQVDHNVDWTHFGDVIKRSCLTHRARETVQDVATHTSIYFADATLHKADHQIVFNKIAFV